MPAPETRDDVGVLLWRTDEHEELTRRAWDSRVARDAIEAIVTDARAAERDGFWPGHPLDDVAENERICSLYLGSAGMIWALWKLDPSFDAPAALDPVIERYRAIPDFGPEEHAPSLWMGETGLLVVADKVGSRAADSERLGDLAHRNRAHPTWELMWGSPGTMLAARACGLEAEWQESARLLWSSWEESSDLWTQDMYGTVTQYLGPAHGFAGNVHALRGYVDDEILRRRVTRLLERTARRADGLINWLPTPDSPDSKIRVQWCHGAPGLISTVGDLIPDSLLLGAGELIWRAGPIRRVRACVTAPRATGSPSSGFTSSPVMSAGSIALAASRCTRSRRRSGNGPPSAADATPCGPATSELHSTFERASTAGPTSPPSTRSRPSRVASRSSERRALAFGQRPLRPGRQVPGHEDRLARRGETTIRQLDLVLQLDGVGSHPRHPHDDVHLAVVLAHLGVVVEVHVSQDEPATCKLLPCAMHDVGDQSDAPFLDQLVVHGLIEVAEHVHVPPA